MAILKKLTKVGNSSALVIDKPVLDLLEIDTEKPLEITLGPDGKSLIIKPVEDEEDNQNLFEEALKSGNKRHGKALKALAKR